MLQPRLINRDDPLAQLVNLCRVLVNAHHLVAKFRKARAAHKPDVPSPNNRNTHGVVILGHGRLGNRKEGGNIVAEPIHEKAIVFHEYII
jgi:hypothetical protein